MWRTLPPGGEAPSLYSSDKYFKTHPLRGLGSPLSHSMCHFYDKIEINIIKGNNLIIILGIYKAVREIGINKFVSRFLKNSISSKRFKKNLKTYLF